MLQIRTALVFHCAPFLYSLRSIAQTVIPQITLVTQNGNNWIIPGSSVSFELENVFCRNQWYIWKGHRVI